jgi:hypothetical protein
MQRDSRQDLRLAHFCCGQLENIVRVTEEPEVADVRVMYGLAAYRIFALAAPSSFNCDAKDVENLKELVGNLKRPAEEQE